ncbi:MAG: hypothetical protein GX117_02540 [Candidatus Hydrogenedentes bacterium]|nr:hypothetical protein [Candidatus Hydrogenedentota bacterium]
MMRVSYLLLSALLLLLPLTMVAETVVGTVYHDQNGNRVKDAHESGIPGVAISNGESVVVTDSAGRYSIDVEDPGIVFMVKPRGWETFVDPASGLRQFYYLYRPNGSPEVKYGGIAPTGALPESLDFPLRPLKESNAFEILLLGDPQVRDLDEVRYYVRDMIPEVTGLDVAFGCILGDNVYNTPLMFEPYRQATQQAGLEWHYVPGNHDTGFDAPSNEYSYETFQNAIGPEYYAAVYGHVHLLVLNNIHYELPSSEYHAELGEKQQAFVRNYLALVPKDALVILTMHIPIMRLVDRDALYESLAPFPNCISFSAHTHSHAHYFLNAEDDGWTNEYEHHHIVQGTVCGSWYGGFPNGVGIPESLMGDGTPKGYAILRVDGGSYDYRYYASGHGKDYQMDVHVPRQVSLDSDNKGQVVVNFFNGTEKCKLEMRLNNGEWTPMEQYTGKPPFYVELVDRQKEFARLVGKERGLTEVDDKKARQIADQFRFAIGRGMPAAKDTRHLWGAPVPAALKEGFNTVDVRATSPFGGPYEAKGYIYAVSGEEAATEN